MAFVFLTDQPLCSFSRVDAASDGPQVQQQVRISLLLTKTGIPLTYDPTGNYPSVDGHGIAVLD
jgi:hypothetical protein